MTDSPAAGSPSEPSEHAPSSDARPEVTKIKTGDLRKVYDFNILTIYCLISNNPVYVFGYVIKKNLTIDLTQQISFNLVVEILDTQNSSLSGTP